MPMGTEDARVGNPLVTTREPVGPKTAGSKGSVGDVALMDSLAIVIGAWLLLFLIAFSLRHHNI
jgi:hypothetical protein